MNMKTTLLMSEFVTHDVKRFLVEKPEGFNFKAGQELPIHSHDIEGQLTIAVLEGEGEFLAKDGIALPAKPGDVLISDIAEPHGIRAIDNMRVIVTIAPPI